MAQNHREGVKRTHHINPSVIRKTLFAKKHKTGRGRIHVV